MKKYGDFVGIVVVFAGFTVSANPVCRQYVEQGIERLKPALGFVSEIKTISRAELHLRPAKLVDLNDKRPFISEKRARQLVAKAKTRHKQGEYGPRLITDEIGESPDPDKAVWIEHPTMGRVAVIGLSGQQYIMTKSIDDLSRGGLQRPYKIRLINEHGHPYGEDVDAKTGKPIPYARNSSAWDVGFAWAEDANGNPTLKVLAGAMANGGNGKPLLITQKNAAQTRRRMVFDNVQWKEEPAGSGNWVLEASQPRSPFFNEVLRDGTWSRFEADGTPKMIHSYGGGPVRLANGESYRDENGNILWAGDGVFEVRKVVGAKEKEWKHTPYQSGMYIATLDPTMTKVIEQPRVILDARKSDGSIFANAERPGIGPLVEGGHIVPRIVLEDGSKRAIESLEDLSEARRKGLKIEFDMVGSQGQYDEDYGGFQAVAENESMNFEIVTKQDGEMYNITEAFNVISYATGRPVIQVGETGQEYIMWHGDERLDHTDRLDDLSRQIWIAPIKRKVVNGVERIEILDNTGMMDELLRHKPRPLKEKMK